MNRTLVNRVGPPVTDLAFFGRDVELPLLMDRLLQGDHVSLVAQRRVGKTSLMREAQRRLSGERICLWVDLQSARDPADAIVELALATVEHQRLWSRVKVGFQHVLDAVETVGGDALAVKLRDSTALDWAARGDRIFADLAAADQPVVLMIDELSILLVKLLRDADGHPRPGGREQAERLLGWLRKGALSAPGQITVVVTGSVGLEPIAHQAGLSGTLNIYPPFHLPVWEPRVAQEALQALAAAVELDLPTAAREMVVEKLGSCIPYHVQLYFQLLVEYARRQSLVALTAHDVERVYVTRMLASHGHQELAHMEERLRMVLPPEWRPLAADLLTEAAVKGSLTVSAARDLARDLLPIGQRHDEVLRELFNLLEHDGYLERRADGGRAFCSRLLRDWWRARHGEFYLPADQRGAR